MDFSSSNLDRLRDKHPNEHAGARPSVNPAEKPALQVSEISVLKAVRYFPAGSTGGPDGIRPQHLIERDQFKEMGNRLLTSHTAFVNSLLDGRCHKDFAQILFGGRLAMEKKTGGIRPIVVGYVWRRLTAKCARAHAIESLADYFNPFQVGVGVGVAGGCEDVMPPDGSCQLCPLTTTTSSLNWIFQTRSIVFIGTTC